VAPLPASPPDPGRAGVRQSRPFLVHAGSMASVANINDVLEGHVALEIECCRSAVSERVRAEPAGRRSGGPVPAEHLGHQIPSTALLVGSIAPRSLTSSASPPACGCRWSKAFPSLLVPTGSSFRSSPGSRRPVSTPLGSAVRLGCRERRAEPGMWPGGHIPRIPPGDPLTQMARCAHGTSESPPAARSQFVALGT
jgi:hypothetical protein